MPFIAVNKTEIIYRNYVGVEHMICAQQRDALRLCCSLYPRCNLVKPNLYVESHS